MDAAPDPRCWQALALVCVAMFMTVLDVSIVNVALPSIKTSLGGTRGSRCTAASPAPCSPAT